ncbi:lycopene beta-cyclase CrtY [Bdellovibrio sp. SKB1291214]|uniref:lycopene beta-cyclase CrtY n=1 Tax=Bdellovibrio sp. SKB1291214 TaxID=1732569 RepID=UPI000B51E5A4|nr:lycopene beta-cyclase CrtY [Bdellovibrio sp. SKB1291214]UYL07855.1 lycopene beta-cyclase CrtY [Bdellovibrio sp. SKB1291214]
MFDKVDHLEFDCVIVGGGLSGGLLLHGLKVFQPDLQVLLIEREPQLSSHQTWCFHTTDLPADAQWLSTVISKKWSRQKVAFPDYERFLNQEYNAIRAHEFAAFLTNNYFESIRFNCEVLGLDAQHVVLKDGSTVQSKMVIDARGWSQSENKNHGYQKFVGWDVTLTKPHGLDYAFLKDVRVPQIDGYRFFYLLPWTEKSLLVEDTYYSNFPDLDADAVGERIQDYLNEQGWTVESIERKESGCLPLPFFESQARRSEYICLGARSELFHAVTGYTFPTTIARIDLLVKTPLEKWTSVLAQHDQKIRSQLRFLPALNRMLFLAAAPEQRYQVLQRFYKLPADLVSRFYKGELQISDWARILVGKPPVAIRKAIKSLLASR